MGDESESRVAAVELWADALAGVLWNTEMSERLFNMPI